MPIWCISAKSGQLLSYPVSARATLKISASSLSLDLVIRNPISQPLWILSSAFVYITLLAALANFSAEHWHYDPLIISAQGL